METNNKIIVIIGRQVGSGGLTIARRVAEVLGCKLYDKQLLNLAAKESGFDESFFEKSDEQKGFFRAITQLQGAFMPNCSYYGNDLSDENLYRLQSEAIRKAAEEGDCVFVGRTADYVLRDCPTALNVFITAPMENRIRRVSQRQNLDREEAEKFIRDKEKDRANYYNFYTGKRWGHAESYDLCIDSSLLGAEATVQLLVDMARQRAARQDSQVEADII